jgi:hypothetical protein
LNKYNIKVSQGATFSLGLTIKDASNVAINLTGYTFRGQIRKTVSSEEIEAAFTFQIQDQVTNTGEVTCLISATATAAIDVTPSGNAERKISKMCYDIESESPTGVVVRWLEGIADVSPEATK